MYWQMIEVYGRKYLGFGKWIEVEWENCDFFDNFLI